jgi:phosphoglycerate dehydrogenase-like enzyme
VFELEPLPADSPLWTLPGVWLSPHNSASSLGNPARDVQRFLQALRGWLQAG